MCDRVCRQSKCESGLTERFEIRPGIRFGREIIEVLDHERHFKDKVKLWRKK